MFHKLCRITQFSTLTELSHDGSQIVKGSEFHKVGPETAKHLWPYRVVPERGLPGHPAQQNGGDHGWLIQTPMSTVIIIIVITSS